MACATFVFLFLPVLCRAGTIRLDGRLNEPEWQNAALTAELTQQSPRPGAPTPFKTTVRVVIAGDTVFFGFECADPEPAKIAVHTLRRDSSLLGDDTVAIVLDTFGDKRTAYFFQINAAAARVDGLVSDPEHVSLDWDGIWDARAVRTSTGWSAEIEIPVRTLNFAQARPSWGLNLERFIARERLTLRWASPTLDSFFYDVSRAGTLPGVEGLTQGRGLEVSPYITGRMRDAFARGTRAWQGATGFDFGWKITPQLGAVFTVNTDFAETEVDSRQINLTRFPLFFPEKRAFFLEGSNQFTFGLGLGTDFIPFFTRRVGLLEGQPVPINAGLKMNGRVGKWNLALIDVQTRESPLAPAVNLFAGRASYDVTPQLRLGTLLTHGDPAGLSSNTLAGFDAVWQTSKFLGDKNFFAGGWTAFSAGDLPRGNRGGWGFKLDYPNDLLDCALTVNQFGEALSPALGFLPRPGVRKSSAKCDFMPRPSRNGPLHFIRQAFFESRYTRVTNLQGVNESWQYSMMPLGLQFESGDEVEFVFEPQYELVPAPFEIAEGVVIPPGSYRFNRWAVEAETSSHRALRFGARMTRGSFYGGRLAEWAARTDWTSPRGHVQVGLEVEQNFGRLPHANFVQRLWQLNTAWSWSPNLALTNFIQYDSESRNLGSNTRLRWTLKPGRDLFVVWNRGWQRLVTRRDDLLLAPESELLAVKLRWTFRM